MNDEKFKTLDDVLEEQNRLMNGVPFRLTEEEWEQHDKEMSEIIRKDKEKRAQAIQTA